MVQVSRISVIAMILLLETASISRVMAFSNALVKPRRAPAWQRIRLSSTFSASLSATKESDLDIPTNALTIQQLLTDSPTIILKRSRQSKAFRNGNQLVFTRAIQSGTASVASLVEVAVVNDAPNDKQQDDKESKPLIIGWGVYNPNSLYKIRILCHRYMQPSLYKSLTTQSDTTTVEDAMRAIVRHHFQIALQKRRAINLPSENQHTMYRLVNGEGDGLSGLQVDVMGTHVVIQSSAAWCQIYQELIKEELQEAMPDCTLVWKVAASRLIQDGFKDFVEDAEDPNAKAVLVKENGVIFQVYPAALGQKTGAYCDQRENRDLVSQYTRDKTVLDLCCFQGGFGLTAIINGGAKLAVGVDSSATAIESAQENAKLNRVEDKATFLQSDITAYMQQAAKDGVYYDTIVLDPPKLAPTAATLDKARRKYHGLNRDAIKLVNPTEGGILMTCTCSAAMTQKDGGDYFLGMVAGAAQAAGRSVTLLNKRGAASCHTQSPVCQPTGAYLTAALFYVHPVN